MSGLQICKESSAQPLPIPNAICSRHTPACRSAIPKQLFCERVNAPARLATSDCSEDGNSSEQTAFGDNEPLRVRGWLWAPRMMNFPDREKQFISHSRLWIFTELRQTNLFLLSNYEDVRGGNAHPDYFFWSGKGRKNKASSTWQKTFRRLWKLVRPALDLEDRDGKRIQPKSHMFRNTFAV